MIFTPFKLHAIFGLLLIVMGFIFDFGLITTMENFSTSLQKPVTQHVWTKHVYDTKKDALLSEAKSAGVGSAKIFMAMKSILPNSVFEWMVRKMFFG